MTMEPFVEKRFVRDVVSLMSWAFLFASKWIQTFESIYVSIHVTKSFFNIDVGSDGRASLILFICYILNFVKTQR